MSERVCKCMRGGMNVCEGLDIWSSIMFLVLCFFYLHDADLYLLGLSAALCQKVTPPPLCSVLKVSRELIVCSLSQAVKQDLTSVAGWGSREGGGGYDPWKRQTTHSSPAETAPAERAL